MSTEGHDEVVKEVGIFGLKTLLTLNSGGAIVLLTFIGNVYGDAGTGIELDLRLLRWSMGFFLTGIAAAMLSVTVTYLLAQLSGVGHALVNQLSVGRFLALMIAPAVLSFLFFAVGCVCAIFSIG